MMSSAHMGKQLGALDNTEPLKVHLPQCLEPHSYMGTAAGPPYPLTSSQWANYVTSMAPLLNAKGVRRALTILESAIMNLQRAQAFEAPAGFAGASSNLQCAQMCAMMQMQVQQQQHLLFQELQQLPFREGIATPCSAEAAMPYPALPPGMVGIMPMAAAVPWASPPQAAATPAVSSAKAPTGCSGGGSSPAARRRTPQTLSTSLRILEDEGPDCLLIVRRISKLGFKASRSLKKHFSTFGPVLKVLLAHSTARQYQDQQFHVKRRPSNLGFIQMGTAAAANAVLAGGLAQEIEGVSVNVARFERHGEDGEVDDEQGDDVLERGEQGDEQGDLPVAMQKKPKPERRERGMSDVSTAASDESPSTISKGVAPKA